jgi:hypothetical protein
MSWNTYRPNVHHQVARLVHLLVPKVRFLDPIRSSAMARRSASMEFDPLTLGSCRWTTISQDQMSPMVRQVPTMRCLWVLVLV